MNRSTVREFLAPGTGVAPGEVLVPTEVGDPVRGPLPCFAAPLVGGTLLRKGTRVSYAPVGPCADPSQDDGGAALFVATCPQRDGSEAAVAAAPWGRPGPRWRKGRRCAGPADGSRPSARGGAARPRRRRPRDEPWTDAAPCTSTVSWPPTGTRSPSWPSWARCSRTRWRRSRT